ncbi:TetR/AcrR family transcriptional regulator [Arthrobacter sp. B6]|uniref:TetR/AcrR family transcriptional regulator n=1 Tax=Arthrobacter sp. B6 TaxID=1570137 RepID=UPI0009EF1892|nr:TetR/AcrR family transcriptional regulator [Arthrobacter sp. B6]
MADATQMATSTWRTDSDLSLSPILEAALKDLQQHGYHGTTVRSIAAGVGLTMPSLYYHYGSKEGILFALLDIAMDRLLARIEQAVDEAAGDDYKGLSNYVASVALHNTLHYDLARLHDEFRYLGPDLRAKYVEKRSKVQDILVDLLIAGTAAGKFDVQDPRFTARVMLGTVSGIIDWYSPGGSLQAEEIADRYARCTLRMVAAEPDH